MALSGGYDAELVQDEPLARHTSMRVGGPAALVATVHTYPALVKTLEVLARENVGWVVLGKGTNVVASDKGYDGCVIVLGREFSRISVGDDDTVCAGAAAVTSKVTNAAYNAGLTGLEFLSGVPGTIGGAIAMDAGGRHEWIGRRVHNVVCLRPGHGLVRYEGSDVEWGYRRTSLPADEIVLEATFTLEKGEKKAIAEEMDRLLARRRLTQPVSACTCGSVFTNPGEKRAGKLVSDLGMKGLRCGGARISDKHANFIENTGEATAVDVLRLVTEMHDRVKEAYDVELRPEIKFLGFES
jgi:UDP-N-acetylmuramate dehydrogenase